MIHAILIVAVTVVLYPLLWVIKMALSPGQGFAQSPSPIPSQVTLDNFRDVLTARDSLGHLSFLSAAINSVAVALAVTVVGIAFSASAAYVLSRHRFTGRDATMRGFLLSQMFPGVVTTIPLYIILHKLGLLDRLLGLVLVYATTAIPFCVFMLKGAFDALPRALEEAVLVDGGTHKDAFFRVALPLVRPSIAVTSLFCFLTAWNEYILAATFMNSPGSFTLPVLLARYIGDYSTEWGHFAAASLLVSTPVFVLFFRLERHLTGGLTQGGVKG